MELETVRINVPNELLLYSLLGKLAGDSKLQQLVKSLTLNDELIECPDLILNFLQDYVHLNKTKDPSSTSLPSALVSTTNESFKIIHYCTNGKHNPKSTTHNKEECWAENPQNSSPFSVTTGDSRSSLRAYGIGTVELYCKDQPLILNDCLFVPNLSCNLVSLLTLFERRFIINQVEERFTLESKDCILLEGKVINKLMHINYTLPISLLTVNHQNLWHKRLGHPSSQVLKMMGLPLESSILSSCEINKAHCVRCVNETDDNITINQQYYDCSYKI
ncbi:hypothetical protein O181_120379 [Austropuccinia psidii MF-1]|uniref:Retrovirus-related Pol polyprotein from transposon TNT 1-94-like beta-barrel domain-containing protein n=1 Tax=Austropuccinia psidii MF-1 TaxID=1389203 RepID=A0A9Q3KGH7_9BASI|nr:hypothetical protein [Austropuccinia psidii MF-1]